MAVRPRTTWPAASSPHQTMRVSPLYYPSVLLAHTVSKLARTSQKAVSFYGGVYRMYLCVFSIFFWQASRQCRKSHTRNSLVGAYGLLTLGVNLPVGTREPARPCARAHRRFDCDSVPPQTSARSVASRAFLSSRLQTHDPIQLVFSRETS